MKIQKRTLALSLILAFAIGFGACAISQNIGQKAHKQQIADIIYSSGELANSAGYFEGLCAGMAMSDSCPCGCADCRAASDQTLSIIGLDSQKTNDNQPSTVAPENNPREECLPILMDYKGTWLDQNAEPMSFADAERFFSRNRAYAKVAVAINSLCVELQSDSYQYDLDRVSGWAAEKPHDPEEYLDYEWILAEMEANYDYYLNDLLNLIGSEIDYENSPAERTATHIILEKMLEFRADGTYNATIFGAVYQLDSDIDVDRIGESPLFDASLRGTYVGDTNRILK